MEPQERPRKGFVLDIAAAYNRDGLRIPPPKTLDEAPVEVVTERPSVWTHMTEPEQTNILMGIYLMRRFFSN